MRKADKDGVVRLDEKDFLGVMEVHHQDDHFPCVERKGECPVDKRIPWQVFPGWSHDPEASMDPSNEEVENRVQGENQSQVVDGVEESNESTRSTSGE